MADSNPPYAALALAITAQDWTALGLEDDPNVAPSSDLELTVERVTSLLVVRIVALLAPANKYQDLSTTTICRTNLMAGHEEWDAPVTDQVIQEIRTFVRTILTGYNNCEYHNFEHAYHVTISANKMLDLALNSEIHALSKSKPRMFGLRTDALMHLLLIFVGLIHDVEHKGIPNRQLALEDDELALLYNDQSIAENRSLTVAFKELLKDDYFDLRKVMFKEDEEYRRFRAAAMQLVLTTDLASPERTQLRKSKYKEAFGEDFQTIEAKVKAEMKRRSSVAVGSEQSAPSSSRRMSAIGILDDLQTAANALDSLTNTPEGSEVDGSENILEYDETIVPSRKHDGDDALQVPIPGFNRTSSGAIKQVTKHASMDLGRIVRPSIGGGAGDADTSLGYHSDPVKKFQKRLSTSVGQKSKKRLGLSRSIDLSGEFIETYRRSTMGSHTNMSALELDQEEDVEEYDDLKAIVILEQMITACDIAHVLQGWKQMEKFSNRLYLELRSAHVQNRGPDVSPNWCENQIGFLESYNLPLAQRLDDVGVFGPLIGPVFARLVEANRDQWLEDGQKVTDDIVAKGAEKYPL